MGSMKLVLEVLGALTVRTEASQAPIAISYRHCGAGGNVFTAG